MNLETLPVGASARIDSLQGGRGFLSHVREAGLELGMTVRKEHQEETGPIMIRCGPHRIALGRGIARRILVQELHD